MDYTKQANDFLRTTGTEFSIKFKREVDRFPGEGKATGNRNQFEVTLKRGGEEYVFIFTDSIANYTKGCQLIYGSKNCWVKRKIVSPSAYSVLACLTKYDPGDFDNFCQEYGYSFSSEREYLKVKQVHIAVWDEYRSVHRLFWDVMELLQEIQ